jgi:multidrug efflux pump subunit AcrB
MFVPVMTSSLTTVVAFIPLLMIGGMLGPSILVLPTVILCVVVASVIECFLVLPGHLKHSLAGIKPPAADSYRARFDAAFLRFRKNRFEPLLQRALDHPGATVCAAIGMAIITLSLVASERVGFEMNVGFSPEELSAQVEFSAAATDEQKFQFIKHLEDTLQATDAESDKPNLLDWVLNKNLARFNDETQQGQQYASLRAMYAFKEERSVPPEDFVERWKEAVQAPPYVEQLHIAMEGGINNGNADIELVLTGDELTSLKAGAEELAIALGQYPGVSNVIDNLPYGSDQLVFELTPTGRALGLTSQELGRQMHAAYSGRRVQIFNLNENEVEVRVMLPDQERDDPLKLQQFPIKTADGQFVPLANVARFYNRRGVDLIRHNGTRMSINITANVDSQQNSARAVISELEQSVVPGLQSRYGLSYGLSGFSQEEQLMLEVFSMGIKLSLIMIFLILAWVFSSYLWPLAIMLAIPFGVTGAIFGHWVMGMNLTFMSLLGLLALTGVAVNDSIVLMTFLRQELKRGLELKAALYNAVASRFRAVLLTSLTTIAGLLPLMFESSSLAAMIRPLAVTICFGLAFATLLVLLVIPAFILLLEKLKNRMSPALPKWLNQWSSAHDSSLQGAKP